MQQIGTVTARKLAEMLDEFLSADNADNTEVAAMILSSAYEARANVYRDATPEELEMPERARQDYIRYFTTCADAVRRATVDIKRIGERLVMPA